MTQDWTNDNFAGGHVAQTDLTNMEKNFICLRTLFSGAGAPPSMAACHPWFDTTKHIFKVRADDNSEWLGLMHGDVNSKMWIYRNDVLAGWAIDATVTDKILALKGGVNAYNVAGGNPAGTWTQPNHTHAGPSHAHPLPIGEVAAGTALCYKSTQTSGTFVCNRGVGVAGAVTQTRPALVSNAAGTGATSGGATANTYRPSAAVGTLQYLDI